MENYNPNTTTVGAFLEVYVGEELSKMSGVVNACCAEVDEEFKTAKVEFLELKKKAQEKKEQAKQKQPLSTAQNNEQDSKKKQSTTVKTSKKAKKKKATNPKSCSLKLVALSGPHKDEEFFIRPTTRVPCLLGRSTAVKYVSKGVSLREDDEVSTVHGQFEFNDGKALFVDTGSSNGSALMTDGKELYLEPGYELAVPQDDALMLKVGLTILKVEHCV